MIDRVSSSLEPLRDVAYCGYVCSACSGMDDGCPGCKGGGGDVGCYQKECCAGKQLGGCWECAAFPCDNGCFANPDWRGLSVGFCETAKRLGVDALVALVQIRLGGKVDYGAFQGKTSEEVQRALHSDTGG